MHWASQALLACGSLPPCVPFLGREGAGDLVPFLLTGQGLAVGLAWSSPHWHLGGEGANLVKEIDFQEIQETLRVPKMLDTKRNTPRHIIIKLPKIKDKERILKEARGKETVTYIGVPIRLSADFSEETLQARRGWKEVFEGMKAKDLRLVLLYSSKAFI